VLLTCFNRPLADHVRAGLSDVEGVQVAGFHQLSFDLCREAGVATPGDRDVRAFWDEQLPAFLAEAVDALAPRFDALIADEAQDFDEAWWLPLQMLCATRITASCTCSRTTTRRSTDVRSACPRGSSRRASPRCGGTHHRSSTR
jgi:hypothetical protein